MFPLGYVNQSQPVAGWRHKLYWLFALAVASNDRLDVSNLHTTLHSKVGEVVFSLNGPQITAKSSVEMLSGIQMKMLVLYIDSVLPDLPVFCHFNHAN